jgi:hypothetical protein
VQLVRKFANVTLASVTKKTRNVFHVTLSMLIPAQRDDNVMRTFSSHH